MPTDSQSLDLKTDVGARALMKRLWKRGFHCFDAAKGINPDLLPVELDEALKVFDTCESLPGELAYAVLEFQIYTRWAPRLGVNKRAGKTSLLVPSDETVRNRLNAILTATPPEVGSPWSPIWEECLKAWETGPQPSDDHGQDGYCCPVRIERLTRKYKNGKALLEEVSEQDNLDDRVADRPNVWFEMAAQDDGYLFCARDVSGWFQPDSQDPAYIADPEGPERGYTPPADLVSPSGLHRRRAFARGAKDPESGKFGPTITPWGAVEFRPKLLSKADQQRIKTTARWGGIFRIIRAVAQVESRGAFDCMQAYDKAFLSLPLLHAAASRGDTGGVNELGGLLRWLAQTGNHPTTEGLQLKTLRLMAHSTLWRDGAKDETDYDTGSGEGSCTASGVVGAIETPLSLAPYAQSIALLRRPHMIYRFAMHLRTQPITRHAMWALAVHRLRQIAWLRIPASDDLPLAWRNRPLGEVVHTEQGMALLLRYAVKKPGSVFTNSAGKNDVFVAKTIGQSKTVYNLVDYALLHWMKQAWSSSKGDDALFQAELINILQGKTPFIAPGGTASVAVPAAISEHIDTMSSLLRWDSAYPRYLHKSEVHNRLSLSAAAGSSPFVIAENNTWRLDDAQNAWWEADAGHPPPAHAPTYLVPDSLAAAAQKIGIAPVLLSLVGVPGKPGSKKDDPDWVRAELLAAQTARELHAVAASGKARSREGTIVDTQRPHTLAAHGDYNQRWSRLYLQTFVARGWESLLLCAAADTRPEPEEALWALDAPQARTHDVSAFDARDGSKTVPLLLGRSENKKQLHVFSLDNKLSLPQPTDALGKLTRRVYQAALGFAIEMDSFDVDQQSDSLAIRLGSLRHSLPMNKASQKASGGDIGLFFELLAWRADVQANPTSPEARFLREAGVGLQTRQSKASLFSFSEARLKVDRWAPSLPLLFSTAHKDKTQAMSNAELAIWLLNWPALHRFRVLLRESEMAQQAMRDVWRIGLRSVLDVQVIDFGITQPARPRVFHLFQSEPVLAKLAHWVWYDVDGFRKALGSKAFGTAFSQWLAAPPRKDVSQWTLEDEGSVFWDMLLPQLPDSELKQRLNERPAGTFNRAYHDSLNKVIDLQGLEGTELPGAKGASATTGFIVTPLTVGKFGIALLTTHETSAPSVTAAGGLPIGEFWITSIAPVFHDAASSWRGASLALPTPVLVSIAAGGQNTSVQLAESWNASSQPVVLTSGALQTAFSTELDVTSWLGGLGDGVTITLRVQGEVNNMKASLFLGLRLNAPWLRVPLEYPLTQVAKLHDIEVINSQVEWTCSLEGQEDRLAALPFRATGIIKLSVGLDSTLQPNVHLNGSLTQVDIQLGSPVATLKLVSDPKAKAQHFLFDADLRANEASLALSTPDKVQASLHLQLAVLSKDTARVVPMLLSGGVTQGRVLAPFSIDLGSITVPNMADPIRFSTAYPEIPVWIFKAQQREAPTEYGMFTLQDINESWLGKKVAGLGLRQAGNPIPKLDDDNFSVQLSVQFFLAGEQFKTAADTATITLTALCKHNGTLLVLSPQAFACKFELITLAFTIKEDSRVLSLGGVASLHLPEKLNARLDLSGTGDALRIDNALALHIPDDKDKDKDKDTGFIFDIDELSLGQAGMSLKAHVRRGETLLKGLSGISSSLTVRPAQEDGSGTLCISRGRLVSASIKADARLTFFDDADGVLSLTLYQHGDELGALATFELPLGRKFNVRALYLEFQIDAVQLGLRFENNNWTTTGGMTGSLAFKPNGSLLGRLAEYGDLFDGTQVHFENFDLANLGTTPIRILTTPRTFTVGGLFEVVLRGFQIPKLAEFSPKSVGLIGDIRLLAKLPDMNVSLTLGDIRLWQPTLDSLVPKIKIFSLGLDFAIPSGFEFEGRAIEYDDEQEYGFGGVVRLKTDVFPGIDMMLKLTRIRRNGKDYPSVVVFGAMDRTDSLAYGFFLRRAGVGVTINQELKGLSGAQPIAKRVEEALSGGMVNPGLPESWVARTDVDTGTHYALVAQAQVSYGLMSRDTDHPFMSTMVLMIDENFDIIAGVNAWLMVSPNDALRKEFIASPAVRGAIGLSPREQVLYGRFMTMKNASFGPSAEGSVFGRMLKNALDAAQLSTSLYCDPRGTLLEVGYPRQAKFNFNFGPVTGSVEAGFRFGYYRGTHVVGLNLAATATLSGGLAGDFGFAEVSISYKASFALQGSFAGALTNSGQAYILAELVVSASFEIAVNLRKRINISGFGFSYDITLFDLSGSASITASAAVNAALVPDGLGFNGSVIVTLNICGFGFDARLYIASNAGRVDDARRRINELVPPIDDIIRAPQKAIAAITAQPDAPPAKPEMPTHWCYHVRIVNNVTRVVFYPDAANEQGYPALQAKAKDEIYRGRTHTITLKNEFTCTGVLGRPDALEVGKDLELKEDVNQAVVLKKYVSPDDGAAARDILAGDLLTQLAGMTPLKGEEIVDPRTHAPVAGDFDDPAVLANPRRRSTRFRKRYRASGSDPMTWDDHLLLAQEAGEKPMTPSPAMTDAELLVPLLRFAEDPHACVHKPEQIGAVGADGMWRPNPHFMASTLGLVLEFEGTAVAAAIAEQGIGAIASATKMFGVDINPDCWSDAAGLKRNVSFQFDGLVGHDFQGLGEVGLNWQIVRTELNKALRTGPANHRGIRHFRITREVILGAWEPRTFEKHMPCWGHYCAKNLANDLIEHFYIRPQFQLVDDTLPKDRALLLRYIVQAIGDPMISKEGKETTDVLCEHCFEVDYRPATQGPLIVNSQAVLQRQSEKAGLEFLVAIDLIRRPEDMDGITAKAEEICKRLKIFARPVLPGQTGLYGTADETDISLVWRKDLQGSEIRLPQPVASRRMSESVLSDAVDLGLSSDAWTLGDPATIKQRLQSNSNNNVITLKATIALRGREEVDFWKAVMARTDARAVEYYVQLTDFSAPGELVQMATPLQRMRLAVTVPGHKTGPLSDEHLETAFTEGREVGAIEKISLGKASREREWLNREAFRAQFDFLPGESDGQSSPDVLLRISLRHQTAKPHPYGPPVAYRIWARDVMDNDAAPLDPVRHFSVLPEKIWQALPERVVLARGGNSDKEALDWRFENKLLGVSLQAPASCGNTPPLSEQTFHNGDSGIVHWALSNVIQRLESDGKSAHVVVDEPLLKPRGDGSSGDRAAEILARYPEEADPFGWHLLEALGACVSMWVEFDDDRLEPQAWVADRDNVSVITFNTLEPIERGTKPLPLYSARLFAQELLVQLCSLKTATRDELTQFFLTTTTQSTALAQALQWLCPPQNPGEVPDSWLAYLEALIARSQQFVTEGEEQKEADMYRLSYSGATHGIATSEVRPVVSRAGSPTLPEIEGEVKVAYRIAQGYASHWRVAVEVIRRYDWLATQKLEDVTGQLTQTIREIEVPRTGDLEEDIVAMSLDPNDGTLCASIQVSPAQKVHLYSHGIKRRVQFVDQKVLFERDIPSDIKTRLTSLLSTLNINWDALEATWQDTQEAPAQSRTWFACAGAETASQSVTQGHNQWRIPFLPAIYQWRVIAVSQAGIRRSNDHKVPAPENTFGLRPMFEAPANQQSVRGLQYKALRGTWQIAGSRLTVLMPFARALDSLPPELRNYWIRVDDKKLTVNNSENIPGTIPGLELPDVDAVYVIRAQVADAGTVDLCRISVGATSADLLVRPYGPVDVITLQFSDEQPWSGCLGLQCTIDLSAPELAWLTSSSGGWVISLAVERDGVRYDVKQEGV